jgi:hypothetical protein
LLGVEEPAAASLRLAIQPTGDNISWNTLPTMHLNQSENPPLVVVPMAFPPGEWPSAGSLPPPELPVLLDLCLSSSSDGSLLEEGDIESLTHLLEECQHISHLAISGWEAIEDFERLSYVIRRLTSLARGTRRGIEVAVTFPAYGEEPSPESLLNVELLAVHPDTSSYVDAVLFKSPGAGEIQEEIYRKVPHVHFWETVCLPAEAGGEEGPDPVRTISCLLERVTRRSANTSLWIIQAGEFNKIYPLISRFSRYLDAELFRNDSTVKVKDNKGNTIDLPLFFRADSHQPLFFIDGDPGRTLWISLDRGYYKKAAVENLVSGLKRTFKIYQDSTVLVLRPGDDLLAVSLVPRKTKDDVSRHWISVTGEYKLSAAEIVARTRAWQATQRSKLKMYTATMTTSMRLRIGNLKETFDLTIKGPVFARRGFPYDWVWREFWVNGVLWKSKKVPKIPLLQPEKVNILPLDIYLTEDYSYTLEGRARIGDDLVYIIDFKPREADEAAALYRGRIWIDSEDFAIHKEHLIQLHLKGEVLSNVETRWYRPLLGAPDIRLPVEVAGQQVFSTAGRISNVERKVLISDITVNPPDFESQQARAYGSDFQMVRDTDQGLRYLIKNKKTGQLEVEWAAKRSQLFGVIGGFYDSSFSYPIPILGIDYMNFNLGGKGRQLNVLFGGTMVTANYSDPSFLGIRMDLGANLVAVAFPFSNRVYRDGVELEPQRLKRWPLRFQINAGFPLGTYFKYSSFLFMEYHHFARAKTTGEDFVVPRSSLILGWRSRLTANYKGFRLALWGEIARRNRWSFWGEPGNTQFDPGQVSFQRWRVTLSKDFFFSAFRRLSTTAGYFDGLRLDRFSAYKFGFFNELNVHGFMSGAVQATRALAFNLSYGYSVGEVFRLEAFYDSIWVSNRFTGLNNRYFSGTALAGTMNVPGLNAILRFEVGMPVKGNGIKGFVLYFVLLKMF